MRALAELEKVSIEPLLHETKTQILHETKTQIQSPICPQPRVDHQKNFQTLLLPDGRQLAYSFFGKTSGFPVFYFHSTGSSRLECALFHESALRLGYQLIAVDRPGIGRSDFKTHLKLAEISADVVALADALNFKRFGLLSFATGGIFALTTAFYYPARISFQLSLGGIPGNLVQSTKQQKSYVGNCARSLLPYMVWLFTRIKHSMTLDNPGANIERLHQLLNYTDRKILSDPEMHALLKTSMQESLRQGFHGVAQDTGLSFKEPGFQLREVSVPVSIWQGCADNLHSRSSGEYLAARIPSGCFHSVANRGHFFFVHCMDEIFTRTKYFTHSQPVAI